MALPLPVQFTQQPGGIPAMLNSLTSDALKNKMQELQNQFYGPKTQADIDSTQAKTANQLIMNQDQPAINQSDINYKNANTNKLNTMTPLEAAELQLKNQWYPKTAQADIDYKKMGGGRGGVGNTTEMYLQNFIGLDNPQLGGDQAKLYEASNVLRQGGDTLSDGTKLNPISPAVREAMNRVAHSGTYAGAAVPLLKANQASAELKTIVDMSQKDFAPYADTYAGYSPQQIADTFKSDDASQERLGNFIASQAAQYEAAQIRNRIAQGEAGVSATEELMGRSAQIIKTLYPHLSAKARLQATKRLDEYLQAGLKSRNSVGIGTSSVAVYPDKNNSNLRNSSSNQSQNNDPLGIR